MKLGSKRFRFFITMLVLAIFAIYFVLNIEKFKPLLHVNILWLVLLAVANVVVIAVNGMFIKFVLQPFDKFISIMESAYVSLISSIGNFFAPVGAGFGIRAVYLNKKHGLPYGEYISTLSGNYIIVFLVNSFIALLSLYFLKDKASPQYTILVALFLGIFIVSLIAIFIKIPKRLADKAHTKNLKIVTSIFGVLNGWSKIKSNRKLMTRLVGLIFLNVLLALLISKIEVVALHFSIGAAQLLLFSVLGALSLFINLTPANLGVKEAIYLFSASVIGFSTSQILLIALIDRGVLFIVLLAGWFLSTRLSNGNALPSIS